MKSLPCSRSLALFIFLLFAPLCAVAQNNRTTDTAPFSQQIVKRAPIPQLDELIEQIHADIKDLRFKYVWLSSYNDDCLRKIREGNWIYYVPPPWGKDDSPSQLSEQLGIGYGPLDSKKDFVYWSNKEEENICSFPSLGSKVYIYIMNFNKEENPGLAFEIRYYILKRCRALQDKIKKGSE
jgi:hypothetical protein